MGDRVYSFSLTTSIDARPSTVWRALCLPQEVVKWDTGVTKALDAPPDYPQVGQHVRWQYAAGPFRTLHDRPQEVEQERTLRSLITLGPLRLDETYTLESRGAGTRLTTRMLVLPPWPVLGSLFVRYYAGPQARRTVAASMSALKRYCETEP